MARMQLRSSLTRERGWSRATSSATCAITGDAVDDRTRRLRGGPGPGRDPRRRRARDSVAEVLQYAPVTDTVFQRPVLIVPPLIGRFYFLDLRPGRSFVEYAARCGLQAFMLSWRNPTTRAGRRQPPPVNLGSERYPVVGPAPGLYVRG
jgi:poly(3-hydroxyalkanoate) synthetase